VLVRRNQTAAITTRQPRRRPSRPELSLLLWAAGQLKRPSRRRRRCGDEAATRTCAHVRPDYAWSDHLASVAPCRRSSSDGMGEPAARSARTHLSGAAIDDYRFVWRAPERRLMDAWRQEPEQARGRFDGDRCFAWERRCCSTPGQAMSGFPFASTSETTTGCSGVTPELRSLKLDRSSHQGQRRTPVDRVST
jgi:hypothetical protein